MAKKQAKRAAKPTTKPTAKLSGMSVNEYCAKHKLNAKSARAMLRRKFGEKHEHGSRWRMTAAQFAAVLG